MSQLYPGDRVLVPHPAGGRVQATIELIGVEDVLVILDDGTQMLVSTDLVFSLGDQSELFMDLNRAIEILMVGIDPSTQWDTLLGLSIVVGVMLADLEPEAL